MDVYRMSINGEGGGEIEVYFFFSGLRLATTNLFKIWYGIEERYMYLYVHYHVYIGSIRQWFGSKYLCNPPHRIEPCTPLSLKTISKHRFLISYSREILFIPFMMFHEGSLEHEWTVNTHNKKKHKQISFA